MGTRSRSAPTPSFHAARLTAETPSDKGALNGAMRQPILALLALAPALLLAQAEADPFVDGLAAIRQEQHQHAVTIFTGVIAQKPDQARAWYYRGISRDALGDAVGALHDLDRALLLTPKDHNIRLKRAEAYIHAGRYEEAEADLVVIIGEEPDHAIGTHARFDLGQVHMALGNYETALAVYTELVERSPQEAKAYCNRGIVQSKLGAQEAAVADLSKALLLDPDLVMAYGSRAIALIALDRRDEACQDLVQARERGDASMDETMVVYCL
ncbi:MAG: tetratricopeptide repeat protein [Flavobacteriales bacterium]|nr:tetratricopeptide repeat protein [Flavobacteriales bacterium]